MIAIERRLFLFKVKDIWFSDRVHDVEGCARVCFQNHKDKMDLDGFTRKEFYTSVIDLTQSLDAIWGNMGKKSCRYAIKRAQRDGITVGRNEHYGDFYQIYKSFNRKKGMSGLESLTMIEKAGTLFVAKLGGEVIAGHVYLEGGDEIVYWLAATRRLDVDKKEATIIGNASHLLHWEAIKYAKDKGIRDFDMGGLFALGGEGYPGYSVDCFKRSFGGQPVTHYSYWKDYWKVYSAGRWAYQLLRAGHPGGH